MDNLEIPKKEETEQLARMYAHGIMNKNDNERLQGAIQYGGKDYLENDVLVVRKPYASLQSELTYTVFERLRAGLDIPSIFGASNASRDQVTIWNKLNEYNQNNPNTEIDLKHIAHSLGVSSTKNAMNWADYQKVSLDNLNANLTALGTSYPIHSDLQTGYFDKAKGLFGKTKLDYSIAPRDCVGTCLLIGRTPSTAGNTDIGIPLIDLLPHHGSYVRDLEVINFIYKNKDDTGEILRNVYEQNQRIWNREPKSENFGPIFKRIESDTLEGEK